MYYHILPLKKFTISAASVGFVCIGSNILSRPDRISAAISSIDETWQESAEEQLHFRLINPDEYTVAIIRSSSPNMSDRTALSSMHAWIGLLGLATFLSSCTRWSIQLDEDAVDIQQTLSLVFRPNGMFAGSSEGMASRSVPTLLPSSTKIIDPERLEYFLHGRLLGGLAAAFTDESNDKWAQLTRNALRCLHKGLTRPWPEDQAVWYRAANDQLLGRKDGDSTTRLGVVQRAFSANLAETFHNYNDSPQHIGHNAAHGNGLVSKEDALKLRWYTIINVLLSGIVAKDGSCRYTSFLGGRKWSPQSMDEELYRLGVVDLLNHSGPRLDPPHAVQSFWTNGKPDVPVPEEAVRVVSAGRQIELSNAAKLCAEWNVFEGTSWEPPESEADSIESIPTKGRRLHGTFWWLYDRFNRL